MAGVGVLGIPARYQPLTRPQKMGVPPRLTTSSRPVGKIRVKTCHIAISYDL
jgi:hypothetical protein